MPAGREETAHQTNIALGLQISSGSNLMFPNIQNSVLHFPLPFPAPNLNMGFRTKNFSEQKLSENKTWAGNSLCRAGLSKDFVARTTINFVDVFEK